MANNNGNTEEERRKATTTERFRDAGLERHLRECLDQKKKLVRATTNDQRPRRLLRIFFLRSLVRLCLTIVVPFLSCIPATVEINII